MRFVHPTLKSRHDIRSPHRKIMTLTQVIAKVVQAEGRAKRLFDPLPSAAANRPRCAVFVKRPIQIIVLLLLILAE